MPVVVAWAVPMKQTALRPVCLHRRVALKDCSGQIVSSSLERIAFPVVYVLIAAPHIGDPTVAFENVDPRSSHITALYT